MNYPFKMTMTTVRYLTLFFVLSAFLFSCSNGEETRQGAATHTEIDSNLPLAEQIDLYIEQDRYDEALELLSSEDPDSPDTLVQLEKTHLNYGLHSMNTSDQDKMTPQMNKAVKHESEGLKINSDSQVGREEIEQTMMIYATVPDREPEPEVLQGLREVGINY